LLKNASHLPAEVRVRREMTAVNALIHQPAKSALAHSNWRCYRPDRVTA
jgi:hypothetical protein